MLRAYVRKGGSDEVTKVLFMSRSFVTLSASEEFHADCAAVIRLRSFALLRMTKRE